MKAIASFTIDHMKLFPGIYVSRKDKIGDETITTFDIRMTRPNFEEVMTTGEMHCIEHLAATYIRNHNMYGDKTIYFGPMGCRTGFYLLLAGDYSSNNILPVIIELFEFIKDFSGEIPGATAEGCGNFSDMDLPKAIKSATKYLEDILYNINETRLNYPN